MKTLLKALVAGLFIAVMAVSQVRAAADAPSAPANAQWYYLQAGWYLMAPADANHAAQAATANAPVALPAGMVPASAPVVAITAPTIRVRMNAEPAATTYADNSSSTWDEPATGNNSTSGSLGSMR